MPISDEFLRQRPEAQFFGSIPQGLLPAQQRFFGQRFNPIYNQYQGALGRQSLQGQDPQLEFGDFISNFDWINQYFGAPRRDRGFYPGRFAPTSRFLFGF